MWHELYSKFALWKSQVLYVPPYTECSIVNVHLLPQWSMINDYSAFSIRWQINPSFAVNLHCERVKSCATLHWMLYKIMNVHLSYHMIMLTICIVISARIAKKSTITWACSPIALNKIPKAMQNAMIPVGMKAIWKICGMVNIWWWHMDGMWLHL